MGSKWDKNATFTVPARRFSPRRRVFYLSEGNMSSSGILVLRLGEGKLHLGD